MSVAALILGGLGAAVGYAIDSNINGYASLTGPPLGSRNAIRTPAPVSTLDDLWMRVRQGDKVEVTLRTGETVKGTFVQVSSSVLTLVNRQIPASEIRLITRPGNRYRTGAAAGGMGFGAVGMMASAGCDGNGCGNPLLVGIFMGMSGALWGTAIEALTSQHPRVFESSAPRTVVRVTPLLAPARAGVMLAVSF